MAERAEEDDVTIIAFINPRSGGQVGASVYKKLQSLLGPDNVFDLTQGGPVPGLKKFRKTKNLRILACGGDGTVGWVLSSMDKVKMRCGPAVVPLPLGTANDMSRVLKWGANFTGDSSDLETFISDVRHGVPVKLDRWRVYCVPLSKNEIAQYKQELLALKNSSTDDEDDEKEYEKVAAEEMGVSKGHSVKSFDIVARASKVDDEKVTITTSPSADLQDTETSDKKEGDATKPSAADIAEAENNADRDAEGDDTEYEVKDLVINNYFSVGVDSQIALDFHLQRSKHPGMFPHHIINKAWYGVFSLRNVLQKPLHRSLIVEIDDKRIRIPKKVRALVVSQIPSYAAGADLWGLHKKDSHFKQPLSDDGLFEVIGVAGVAHLGRLKMSVSHGLRLGQGSKLKLINVRAIAAQNDGEPWILPPSTTTVTFYNQSTMLFNIRKGVKHLRKLVGSTDDDKTENTEIVAKEASKRGVSTEKENTSQSAKREGKSDKDKPRKESKTDLEADDTTANTSQTKNKKSRKKRTEDDEEKLDSD